jgi:Ca-activated chloride channel family protein
VFFDLQALKMFLQSLKSNLPSISSAVVLTSKMVSGEFTGGTAMILISGGENHDSKIKEAVNAAKKKVKNYFYRNMNK